MRMPMPIAGEHRGGVREQGDQGQRAEHGDDQPGERPAVEPQAQAGRGGLLGVDPQRRRVVAHPAMMTVPPVPIADVGRAPTGIPGRDDGCCQDRPMAETSVPRGAILRVGLTPGAAVMLVGRRRHRPRAGGRVRARPPDVRLGGGVQRRRAADRAGRDVRVAACCRVGCRSSLVLIVMLAVIAALVAGVATDLNDSLDDLKSSAPAAAESLQERYDFLERVELASRVSDFVDDLDSQVRQDAVSEAIGTAPTYVVTGILMLFLLAYGRRYFDGFSDQFAEPRRGHIRRVGQDAATNGPALPARRARPGDRHRCRRRADVLAARHPGRVQPRLRRRAALRAAVDGHHRRRHPGPAAGVRARRLDDDARAARGPRGRCRRSRRSSCGPTSTPAPSASGRRCRSCSGCWRSSSTGSAGPCTPSPSASSRSPASTAPGGSAARSRTAGRHVTGSDHSNDCSSNVSFGLCSIDSTAPWMRVTASTTACGCCGAPPTRMSR